MSRIRVLYAEDEIFLGKIVKETLDSRGFEVIMVTNGAAVLPAYQAERPDICVLDIMMPDRNGFEVAEDIRAMDEDIPIIFLTAKTQTEDLVQGFRTGANDYIRKPFSMEELIVRIENTLRVTKRSEGYERIRGNRRIRPRRSEERSFDEGLSEGRSSDEVQRGAVTANGAAAGVSGGAAEVIAIGTYSFYPYRQALVAGGEEKKLSYRENELLRQLWLGRDHIIPREDILQAIWGNDSFLNSRNLDVYVTKLRGYLKGDERVEILTIKGIGYRFVLP